MKIFGKPSDNAVHQKVFLYAALTWENKGNSTGTFLDYETNLSAEY